MDQAATLLQRVPEQAPHLRTGQRGEEMAYFYLRRMGYTIVARNYRSHRRKGEIDMIGRDGDVLCFIEVKTRTTRDVKPAEAAVDVEKQRDLRAMAREYLRRLPAQPHLPQRTQHFRFDVVTLYLLDGSNPEFTLFKNAFAVS